MAGITLSSHGRALRTDQRRHGVCVSCRKLRGLRTICMFCGKSHVLNNGLDSLDVPMAGVPNFTKILRLRAQKSISIRGTSLSEEQSMETLHIPTEMLDSWIPVEQASARERGINYLWDTFNDSNTVENCKGDMLFLMRNLAAVAVGQERELLRCILDECAYTWMSQNNHLPDDAEMGDILNFVEALHVLKHIGVTSDKPLVNLADPDEQAELATTEIMAALSPRSQEPRVDKGERNTDDAGVATSISSAAVLNALPDWVSSGKRASSIEQPTKNMRSPKKRQKVPPVVLGDVKRRHYKCPPNFCYDTLLQEVANELMNYDVTDVIGCNPLVDEGVPLTHRRHCAHCGCTQHKKDADRCSYCDAFLRQKVDYGALTDAVVWAYLFEDIGISVQCASGAFGTPSQVFLGDVARFLPMARNYQPIDELGHDFYRLQGYFLTHFLYVFTDWGRHQLRRELFWEEFSFLVQQMRQVINLQDPELVGEFLQCLFIFGVTKEDVDIWPLVKQAMGFLVETEQKFGAKGLWVNSNDDVYSRYHSSYCAVIGIMDMQFSDASPDLEGVVGKFMPRPLRKLLLESF